MFIDPSCVRFCAGGFLSNVIVMAMDGYVRLWDGIGREGKGWDGLEFGLPTYLLLFLYIYLDVRICFSVLIPIYIHLLFS